MLDKNPDWHLYMILTKTGALYTGITTDVARRFQEHKDTYAQLPNAKGAKYFRGNQPDKIVYQETHTDRSAASRRERAIKAMTKQQKLDLINHNKPV
ncbi:MAG: endonuclease [Gammaproteobacteria bacterium]|nr:MAG: endonuclease [Gammaproteobacteria bacterium]